MRKIYHVYVEGVIVKNGINCKLKSEFNQYFDKNDALSYKKKLEERFKNVVIEEKKIRDNPYA